MISGYVRPSSDADVTGAIYLVCSASTSHNILHWNTATNCRVRHRLFQDKAWKYVQARHYSKNCFTQQIIFFSIVCHEKDRNVRMTFLFFHVKLNLKLYLPSRWCVVVVWWSRAVNENQEAAVDKPRNSRLAAVNEKIIYSFIHYIHLIFFIKQTQGPPQKDPTRKPDAW